MVPVGPGRRWLAGVCLLLGLGLWLWGLASHAADASNPRQALLLTINDAIGPGTADYLSRGLAQAREDDAAVLVIQLDTPGGLAESMRLMIKDILASPVPVITWVAPAGARAASAGTYLLYASHIAAMAPATHLGSATPVQIGGLPGMPDSSGSGDDNKGGASGNAMQHKIVEDAVAFIRSLAERRGRNADWAEKAVREAANLNARQAAEQHVIDVVADNLDSLLQQVDGREVQMAHSVQTLHTAGLGVTRFDPDWRTGLLSVIANPNVAYLLMLVGFFGLIFELINPGSTVPGVLGGISLILALFAFQVLSVNYSGLALVLLGLGFIVGEAFVPSFGILGLGGIVAFVVGSVLLMDGSHQQVSLPLIGGIALIAAGFLLWLVTRFLALRRRKPVTGDDQMLGMAVLVLNDFETRDDGRWYGWVRAHGESWQAVSDQAAHNGEHRYVTRVDGLTLQVAPTAPDPEARPAASES